MINQTERVEWQWSLGRGELKKRPLKNVLWNCTCLTYLVQSHCSWKQPCYLPFVTTILLLFPDILLASLFFKSHKRNLHLKRSGWKCVLLCVMYVLWRLISLNYLGAKFLSTWKIFNYPRLDDQTPLFKDPISLFGRSSLLIQEGPHNQFLLLF